MTSWAVFKVWGWVRCVSNPMNESCEWDLEVCLDSRIVKEATGTNSICNSRLHKDNVPLTSCSCPWCL